MMSPHARRHLRKVAKLTERACGSCPYQDRDQFRCCGPRFCETTRAQLAIAGVEVEETGHPALLYMGLAGCVVPPELRPGCTGFLCPEVLDKRTRRLRDKLMRDAADDPVVRVMMEEGARRSDLFLESELGKR